MLCVEKSLVCSNGIDGIGVYIFGSRELWGLQLK